MVVEEEFNVSAELYVVLEATDDLVEILFSNPYLRKAELQEMHKRLLEGISSLKKSKEKYPKESIRVSEALIRVDFLSVVVNKIIKKMVNIEKIVEEQSKSKKEKEEEQKRIFEEMNESKRPTTYTG
jgi:transposase